MLSLVLVLLHLKKNKTIKVNAKQKNTSHISLQIKFVFIFTFINYFLCCFVLSFLKKSQLLRESLARIKNFKKLISHTIVWFSSRPLPYPLRGLRLPVFDFRPMQGAVRILRLPLLLVSVCYFQNYHPSS